MYWATLQAPPTHPAQYLWFDWEPNLATVRPADSATACRATVAAKRAPLATCALFARALDLARTSPAPPRSPCGPPLQPRAFAPFSVTSRPRSRRQGPFEPPLLPSTSPALPASSLLPASARASCESSCHPPPPPFRLLPIVQPRFITQTSRLILVDLFNYYGLRAV
ncbi:hypothetical protein NL676_038933 [Syzygium grande]|nr:hypothetical protein NL676_038933 [Syzygium grande]